MNVGIIGAGSFAEQHARALKVINGLRLIGASRRDLRELQQFSNRHNCLGFPDYQRLLDNPEIDAVLISTPHHRHLEPAIEAARAGKHILIEKPLANTPEDCHTIIDAAQQSGVKLMTGHISRFTEASLRAAEILETGKLGSILQGSGRIWKSWENPDRRNWHRVVETGGGALMTVGIHFFDFFNWISGDTPSGIYCKLGNDLVDQEADSRGNILVRYIEGTSYSLSIAAFKNGTHEMSNELICSDGMLKVDNEGGVWESSKGKWKPMWTSSNNDWLLEALVRMWQDFQCAVETNSKVSVTGEYGLQMVEMVHAAYRANAEESNIIFDRN